MCAATMCTQMCVYTHNNKIRRKRCNLIIVNILIFLCAFHPLCNPTLSKQAKIDCRDEQLLQIHYFFWSEPSIQVLHQMSDHLNVYHCKCSHLISACDLSYNLECICFKWKLNNLRAIFEQAICLNGTEIAYIYWAVLLFAPRCC